MAVAAVEERIKGPEEPCVMVPKEPVVTAAPASMVIVPEPAVENPLVMFNVPVVKETSPSRIVTAPLKLEMLPELVPDK